MFSSEQLKSRIKQAAKDLGVSDVNRVRTIVALERIVARLVVNPFLKEHLVFGGGFVLYKEFGSNRYTKDADAVIRGTNPEKLKTEIKNALALDLNDGFWFGDIFEEDLKAESGYGGIRFNILYKVGHPFPSEEEKSSLRRIHLDISIGVDLEDVAQVTKSDSILAQLGFIEWKVYPPEFIASEKIHCLLYRGGANTRGKDVYDLNVLFREVSNELLTQAIQSTFVRRKFKVKSLYEEALRIETSNLEDSFKHVMIENRKDAFPSLWVLILDKFKELDEFKGKTHG